jgi:hypothetical protein
MVEMGEGQGGGPPPAFDPKELICGACSNTLGQAACRFVLEKERKMEGKSLRVCVGVGDRVHGDAYMEWKCRFCCSLATYFCGGKARFCTPCHDKVFFVLYITHELYIK